MLTRVTNGKTVFIGQVTYSQLYTRLTAYSQHCKLTLNAYDLQLTAYNDEETFNPSESLQDTAQSRAKPDC